MSSMVLLLRVLCLSAARTSQELWPEYVIFHLVLSLPMMLMYNVVSLLMYYVASGVAGLQFESTLNTLAA